MKPTYNILELLEGADEAGQVKLDQLKKETAGEENILWYPNSGNDYRDLMEMSVEGCQKHNIGLAPNLFIHSDYDARSIHIEPGAVPSDYAEEVRIIGCSELTYSAAPDDAGEIQWIRDSNIFDQYHVREEYVAFPDHAHKESRIYLVDVEIHSSEFGKINKQVIYFMWESFNFFEKVIWQKKYRLNITHLVKVREGAGLGGGRGQYLCKFFPLLLSVGGKYLITDDQHIYETEGYGMDNIDLEIWNEDGLEGTGFEFNSTIGVWSEFDDVRSFRAIPGGDFPNIEGIIDGLRP